MSEPIEKLGNRKTNKEIDDGRQLREKVRNLRKLTFFLLLLSHMF